MRSILVRAFRIAIVPLLLFRRGIFEILRLLGGLAIVVAVVATLILLTNIFLATPRDVAFRALDPASPACDPGGPGWTELFDRSNSETAAIDAAPEWRKRLHCAIQRHRIQGYFTKAGRGEAVDLKYDLAFLEFKENGDPYVLCNEGEYDGKTCDGVTFKPTEGATEMHRSQLDALLERLTPKVFDKPGEHAQENKNKNYVLVFIHGWRNNSDIGNENVADLRIYAANAARYVVDRCAEGDRRFCGMNVTAVFVGWRGARTDEAALSGFGHAVARRLCGRPTCWLSNLFDDWGSISAVFTLFDRKPVSEAIAPAVISALRAVESRINIQSAYRQVDMAPCEYNSPSRGLVGCTPSDDNSGGPQSRMIVFGHSLGGNLLATGLLDTALGEVSRHRPGDFVPSPLGNLVVLINPASEAAKWTAIQRQIRSRIVMAAYEKGRYDEIVDSQQFFRIDQKPIMVSVTSARDWPPGGFRAPDCADLLKLVRDTNLPKGDRDILKEVAKDVRRQSRNSEYDRATFDAFPAFRLDFRPLASSMERVERYGGLAPANPDADLTLDDAMAACGGAGAPGLRFSVKQLSGWLGRAMGGVLRTFPFMNTDIEQTHTIGNLDPTRNAQSILTSQSVSPRPFGTTHQLVGWSQAETGLTGATLEKPQPVNAYLAVRGPDAACPSSRYWLTVTRQIRREEYGSYFGWDAKNAWDDGEVTPAVRFEHGYYPAHMAPTTLPGDPFWNMRVIDDVLAKHDGFLKQNFICAMQQLVLDDITVSAPDVEIPTSP